jgi:RimJ/RimL family protein N-acetyltransferase
VFIVWWLLHQLHLFKNRDYHQVVIRRDGRVVHRSGVYPGFPRFPFMIGADLQIGDTWTSPDERGRGLALMAIAETIRRLGRFDRRFWYLCETENTASIRVIEKAGFTPVGIGRKRPRLGLLALGAYVLDEPGVAPAPVRGPRD